MNIHNLNLSFNLQDEDLRKIFTTYDGVISAEIINDRKTGRWLGFGFIEICDALSQNVINKLHETNIDGMIIHIIEPLCEVMPNSDFNKRSRYTKNSYQYS